MGHRNQIGFGFHPETGELWATENAPQGGDEANIIEPGANYGWRLVAVSTPASGYPRRRGSGTSHDRRSSGGRRSRRPG